MITKAKLFFDLIKSLCCIVCICGLITVPVLAANLPSGYTELEYLQSSGTQYIDTGITLNNTSKVTADFQQMDLSTGNNIFGGRNVSTSNAFSFSSAASGGSWRVGWGNVTTSYLIADTNRHTVVMDGTNLTVTLDDVVLANLSAGSFTTPRNCGVFGIMAISSKPVYFSSTKIYSFKLYQDGITLTRNLVPAKHNADGLLGMYDTVSNTFFTNAGTGTFIAGPEVPAIQIATTKYVEDAFSDSITELNTTMGTIKNVVDNTIIQADRIGKLATGKQNRPDEQCPKGRECLLIIEADGSLHWYPICDANGSVDPIED